MMGVGVSRVGKEGRVWGAAEEAILTMTNCDAIKQIELNSQKLILRFGQKDIIIKKNNISICIAPFARGYKALLPIITVSGNSSHSFRFT